VGVATGSSSRNDYLDYDVTYLRNRSVPLLKGALQGEGGRALRRSAVVACGPKGAVLPAQCAPRAVAGVVQLYQTIRLALYLASFFVYLAGARPCQAIS
jgi:hypothetical protein